jgi:hypothetical protein
MDSIADGVDPQKVERFQSELVAVRNQPATFPESLKEAACDIVDDLKAKGKQPEEVIIEMRQLCLESGFSTNQYSSGQANRGLSGLVDKIISICIDHYYS